VYVDWAALNFFARLFRRAVADPEVYTPEWHRRLFETGLGGMNRPRATFLWRADVSRPMWQGNVSDGLFTMVTVNGDAFGMPRLIRNARERMPATFRVYGSANEVGRCNWESAAWCLRAYALGMDGVTPWQSLGNAEALAKPDTNGLIVDAGGRGDAIASFRVHALRRGAQDAELLRLLQLKRGWSREQVGALVAQRIPLAAAARKREGEETAATPPAASLSARAFCELKEGVLQLLAR
jgi:hypothetical protein